MRRCHAVLALASVPKAPSWMRVPGAAAVAVDAGAAAGGAGAAGGRRAPSPFMAGATLVGFSGALLHMYRETPGMTEEDGVRPTAKGLSLAKDVWMLGIGLGLMIDGLTPKRKHHKPARTAATARR